MTPEERKRLDSFLTKQPKAKTPATQKTEVSSNEILGSKENLYGRVLAWTYERGAQGFTWAELKNGLNLSDEELKWVQYVLHFGAMDAEKWFDRIREPKKAGDWDPAANTKNDRFYIAPHGTMVATQYLHLRQLERSSAWAQWTAIASIVITAIIGIGQIVAAFVAH